MSHVGRSRRCLPLVVSLAVVALALATHVSSGTAQAKDRLDAARAQVQSGQYALALENIQWIWNYSAAVEPAMTGVRASFMLLDWRRLGDIYPPAKAALAAARDAAEQKVRANPSNVDAFWDLLALERNIPGQPAPLARFEQMAREYPDAAKTLFPAVKREATDARRIDLLRSYGMDPVSEFALAKQTYESLMRYNERTTLSSGAPRSQATIDLTRRMAYDGFVSLSAVLIGVAVSLGDLPTARSIQTQALAIAPDDPQLKAALPPR